MNHKPYIIAIGFVIVLGFILILAAGAKTPLHPTPRDTSTLTFAMPAPGIQHPGGSSD